MLKVNKPAYKCPTCGKSNYFKSAEGFRPFCSRECLIGKPQIIITLPKDTSMDKLRSLAESISKTIGQ